MSNHIPGCNAVLGIGPCGCHERSALPKYVTDGLEQCSVAQLGRLAEQIGFEVAKREPQFSLVGKQLESYGRLIQEHEQGRLSDAISDSRGGCLDCGRLHWACRCDK